MKKIKLFITVILVLNIVVGSVFVTNAAVAANVAGGSATRYFVTDVGGSITANSVGADFNTSIQSKMPDGDSWYRTQAGLWYYFENDRTTTKRGWFDDPRDGQRYYLDLDTGIMLVGWQEIGNHQYYFNESHNNEVNWYDTGNGWYESYGKQVKAYGSMFRNERTPDGERVDGNGRLIDGGSDDEDDTSLNNLEIMYNGIKRKTSYNYTYLDSNGNEINDYFEYPDLYGYEQEAKFDSNGNLWIKCNSLMYDTIDAWYENKENAKDIFIYYKDGRRDWYSVEFNGTKMPLTYAESLKDGSYKEVSKSQHDSKVKEFNRMRDAHK